MGETKGSKEDPMVLNAVVNFRYVGEPLEANAKKKDEEEEDDRFLAISRWLKILRNAIGKFRGSKKSDGKDNRV